MLNAVKYVVSNGNRSFEDCPYHCDNGYIIDPYTHSKTECPHCAELRKEMVRGNVDSNVTVRELLNLPKSYGGTRFEPDALWPQSELKLFEAEPLTEIKSALVDLYRNIAGGVLPTYSILINLGRHAHTSAFAYPFVTQAFKSKLTVAPYITDYDIRCLLNDKPCTLPDLEFSTLLASDVCVVNILASASISSILACKGLMQLRARSDRVTIFLTDYYGPDLVGLYSDERSMDLAYMLSVKYIPQSEVAETAQQRPDFTQRKRSNTGGQVSMSKDEFSNLINGR